MRHLRSYNLVRFISKKSKKIANFRLNKRLALQASILVAVLLIGGSIVWYHIHLQDTANHEIVLGNNEKQISQQAITSQPKAPITANNIVSLLNQQRKAKGLSALNWTTQLDTAAVSRANYMVTNNTTSVTVGDPGADITNANYNDSSWSLSDAWNESSIQNVVQTLTTGSDANFGLTTSFSDIGVGIVSDTVNGNPTQLIVVYLANQQQGSSTQQSSTTMSQAPQSTTTPASVACIYNPNQPKCVTICNNLNNQEQSAINQGATQFYQIYEDYKASMLNISATTPDDQASIQAQINSAYQTYINNKNSGYQNGLADVQSLPCPITIYNPAAGSP